MTPTPPRPIEKTTSGNPATQAKIAQTVKQQREQKRQEKLAEYQKQLAKRRRSKLVWWTVGSVVAIGVIAAIVASIVFAPAPPPTLSPGNGDGSGIEGVETFENTGEPRRGRRRVRADPARGRRSQRRLAQLRHLRPAGAEHQRRALAGARRRVGHVRRRGGERRGDLHAARAAALELRHPLPLRGHGLADHAERVERAAEGRLRGRRRASRSSSPPTGATRTRPSRTRRAPARSTRPGRQ